MGLFRIYGSSGIVILSVVGVCMYVSRFSFLVFQYVIELLKTRVAKSVMQIPELLLGKVAAYHAVPCNE